MAVYVGTKKYIQALNRKKRELKKASDRTPDKATKFMVMTAKRLAPIHTGATVRGIRRRKRRDGEWFVESWVIGNKGFKQNLWANRTVPFKRPRMRWNKGKPTLYGQGPARWTGMPMFFDVAALKTSKVFRRLALDHTRKALRAR